MSGVAHVLCLCAVVVGVASLDGYKEDICKQEKGALWACKPLRNCPKAQEDLKRGLQPLTCNVQGSEHEVCCEPQGVKLPPTGYKAKEMCKKYAKAVYLTVEYGGHEISLDTCAVVEPLIIKGKDVEPKEYPHMALIGYGDKSSIRWLCGGTLISERFVLSAAHCTDTGKLKLGVAKWVRLGDYNMQSTSDDENGLARSVEYEIVDRFNHPDYHSPSVYNDIALYKLNTDVAFTEFIRPTCLQTDHLLAKTYVIATGWGRNKVGGKTSDILQKVNLTIIGRQECDRPYRTVDEKLLQNGIRDDSMLCAGDLMSGKDTCQGDSGGPLQVRLKEPYCMYSQVGITSFGFKCSSNKPGVYTRVSHYIPWIESIVWP